MISRLPAGRTARVAVNGLGRIGRHLVRQLVLRKEAGLELVAVNTPCPAELSAHLLKFDSMHGRFAQNVKAEGRGLIVDGRPIEYFALGNPATLPWAGLGIDIVIDCAGLGEKSRGHLEAGAVRVLVAGSLPGSDITLCMGVNHERFEPARHRLVCGASCTATMTAPAISVLHDAFGVELVMASFIHSYTGEQPLVDASRSDLRRARAATGSIIPVSTSAIGHLAAIFPWLTGRIDGIALRVPTPLVHMADLVFKVKKKGNRQEMLQVLGEAARGPLKNIMAISCAPLVSLDFRGRDHSCIVDAEFSAMRGNMIKLTIWHDNEHGYCRRIVDLAGFMAAQECAAAAKARNGFCSRLAG
jgi:glyceraldehyde-3-phosphate dehydrogenase type I